MAVCNETVPQSIRPLPFDRLAGWITDRRVLNLLGQYLKRITEQGGQYWEPPGIAIGCPLSPIMGTVFLAGLAIIDNHFHHALRQ